MRATSTLRIGRTSQTLHRTWDAAAPLMSKQFKREKPVQQRKGPENGSRMFREAVPVQEKPPEEIEALDLLTSTEEVESIKARKSILKSVVHADSNETFHQVMSMLLPRNNNPRTMEFRRDLASQRKDLLHHRYHQADLLRHYQNQLHVTESAASSASPRDVVPFEAGVPHSVAAAASQAVQIYSMEVDEEGLPLQRHWKPSREVEKALTEAARVERDMRGLHLTYGTYAALQQLDPSQQPKLRYILSIAARRRRTGPPPGSPNSTATPSSVDFSEFRFAPAMEVAKELKAYGSDKAVQRVLGTLVVQDRNIRRALSILTAFSRLVYVERSTVKKNSSTSALKETQEEQRGSQEDEERQYRRQLVYPFLVSPKKHLLGVLDAATERIGAEGEVTCRLPQQQLLELAREIEPGFELHPLIAAAQVRSFALNELWQKQNRSCRTGKGDGSAKEEEVEEGTGSPTESQRWLHLLPDHIRPLRAANPPPPLWEVCLALAMPSLEAYPVNLRNKEPTVAEDGEATAQPTEDEEVEGGRRRSPKLALSRAEARLRREYRILWAALVDCCGLLGAPMEKLTSLVDQAVKQDSGNDWNLELWTALIRHSTPADALRLVTVNLPEYGLPPTAAVYGALVEAQLRTGRWEQALSTITRSSSVLTGANPSHQRGLVYMEEMRFSALGLACAKVKEDIISLEAALASGQPQHPTTPAGVPPLTESAPLRDQDSEEELNLFHSDPLLGDDSKAGAAEAPSRGQRQPFTPILWRRKLETSLEAHKLLREAVQVEWHENLKRRVPQLATRSDVGPQLDSAFTFPVPRGLWVAALCAHRGAAPRWCRSAQRSHQETASEDQIEKEVGAEPDDARGGADTPAASVAPTDDFFY